MVIVNTAIADLHIKHTIPPYIG